MNLVKYIKVVWIDFYQDTHTRMHERTHTLTHTHIHTHTHTHTFHDFIISALKDTSIVGFDIYNFG